MAHTHKISSRLQKAGQYSIIGCCFFIPLSTTLMGAFGALVLLFWIISGRVAEWPRLVRTNPLVAVATLLIGLFIAGMLYSPAPWEEIIDVFKKYRELFFIPAVLSLMHDGRKQYTDWAITAFFIGCVILLAISYGMAFGIIPEDHYGKSVIQHIAHSFFMAILAFWTMHRTFEAGSRYRLVWGILLAAVIGNIIYIAPGRTGMLTFFVLCILLIWQLFSWKKQLLAYTIFILLTAAAFVSSQNVQIRFYDALHDIRTYEQGNSKTSQGRRLDWWYDSLQLISEKPVFGHGTGSFTMEHDRLIKGTAIDPTDNPHNEYLLIGVQLGVLGILTFLGLFAAAWYTSLRQPPGIKRIAQGVVISMMTGCLMNSFLFDSHQGHYFAFLAALLCVPSPAGNTLNSLARTG